MYAKNKQLRKYCPSLERGSEKCAYKDNMDPIECAEFLKRLNCCNFLDASSNDLDDFYVAHRAFIPDKLMALSIRFTAHWNLFLGSVLNLGTEDQINKVIKRHNTGELGCFCLTESGAGVMSGLVVETTCHYSSKSNSFRLNTPSKEAGKTWISQGLIAEMGVVIAKLFVDGEDFGPHAFFIDMSAPGITRTDMGRKTDFNSLDNAKVSFHEVHLPVDSLLGKFCEIKDGKYVARQKFDFLTLAQRLLSGRVAIPSSMVSGLGWVIDESTNYCKQREVFVSRRRKRKLWELDYMRNAFTKFHEIRCVFEAYMNVIEKIDTSKCTEKEVDLIAVGKVACVGFCIRCKDEMRTLLGSYSLQAEYTYGGGDIFLCAKFAEGDSRILQQKMIRDLVFSRSALSIVFELLISIPFAMLGFARSSMAFSRNWRLMWLMLNLSFLSKNKAFNRWYEMLDTTFEAARLHQLLVISSTVYDNFGDVRELDAFHNAYWERSALLSN